MKLSRLLGLAFAPALSAQLLTEANFEGGHCAPLAVQGAAADSLAAVTSPVRAGRYAGRSLLRSSDAKVSKGMRAEFVDHTAVPLGETRWYALSIYTGWDFAISPGLDGVLFQFHQQAKTGSPVLAFRVAGKTWKITSDTGGNRRTLAVLPFTPHEWTDWVLRVKWAPDATGEWTIWRNGTQVVNEAGVITTYAAEKTGPYAKFGQYHTVGDVAQNIVYFDEYKLAGPASTYADVTPQTKNAADSSAALK